MTEFKELRITPDGKNLIIDVCVKNLEFYKDVYINAIVIDTQDTYTANGPSSSPVLTYEVPSPDPDIAYVRNDCNCISPVRDEEDESICYTGQRDGEKRVRLELNSTALGVSLNDSLFFIYVITEGIPSADTPCGMDNSTVMGVTANLYPFYRTAVSYMKEVENDCDVPVGFINMLMRFKAFELSLKTGHYTQAIKYWDRYFRNVKPGSSAATGCGCNGKT